MCYRGTNHPWLSLCSILSHLYHHRAPSDEEFHRRTIIFEQTDRSDFDSFPSFRLVDVNVPSIKELILRADRLTRSLLIIHDDDDDDDNDACQARKSLPRLTSDDKLCRRRRRRCLSSQGQDFVRINPLRRGLLKLCSRRFTDSNERGACPSSWESDIETSWKWSRWTCFNQERQAEGQRSIE